MGRTACTEPQCLYKGDLYLYLLPLQKAVWISHLRLSCGWFRCETKRHVNWNVGGAVVISTAGLSLPVLLSCLSSVIQNSFNSAILAIGLPALLPTRPHDFNTFFVPPPPPTYSILLLLLEFPFPSRWHQFCAICTPPPHTHTPSNLTHPFKCAPFLSQTVIRVHLYRTPKFFHHMY